MARFLFVLFASFLLSIGTASGQGVIVAAGGGAEGDQGDTSSWSYALYSELVANGDVTADGDVEVAILATSLPTNPSDRNWMPNYFEWIGTTLGVSVSAFNVEVASRTDAEDASLVDPVADADVVFIKGGDQGEYVDLWDGTRLEENVETVANRGGAIGGTSAGAMSLADFTFGPEKDMISTDALFDAHTSYMDDVDGGSGLHRDFLAMIPGVYVETHYTWRGRLGRALGILAKAVDDFGTSSIQAVGIEEYTGFVLRDGVATVHGHGAVSIVSPTTTSTWTRVAGEPLGATHLRLDRLADGWQYDFTQQSVVPPSDALSVSDPGEGTSNSGALTVNGASTSDQSSFARVASFDPYALAPTGSTPFIRDAVGLTDAMNSDRRGYVQEAIFRALYDVPSHTGFLLYDDVYNNATGTISRTSDAPDHIRFGADLASIVLDGSTIEWKGLASDFPSKNGVPYTAGLSGVTVHVLADSDGRDRVYNSRTHAVVSDSTSTDPSDATMVTSLTTSTQHQGPHTTALADVAVTSDGQPVEGATVDVTWSGSHEGSTSATTSPDGTVQFESARVKDAPWSFTITVDTVTASGHTWDATNSETTQTVSSSLHAAGGLQSAPNPASDRLTVRYDVSTPGRVQVRLYNLLGQAIRTLVDRTATAGPHTVTIDTSELSAGPYVLRFTDASAQHTQRVTVVR